MGPTSYNPPTESPPPPPGNSSGKSQGGKMNKGNGKGYENPFNNHLSYNGKGNYNSNNLNANANLQHANSNNSNYPNKMNNNNNGPNNNVGNFVPMVNGQTQSANSQVMMPNGYQNPVYMQNVSNIPNFSANSSGYNQNPNGNNQNQNGNNSMNNFTNNVHYFNNNNVGNNDNLDYLNQLLLGTFRTLNIFKLNNNFQKTFFKRALLYQYYR